MTVSKKDAKKDPKKDQQLQERNQDQAMQPDVTDSSQLPSSHGISPKEMTPKDITEEHASWSDRQTRNISSGDAVLREESMLDEAIELTFPASDPTAELPASAQSVKAALCNDEDEELLDEAIELTFPASDPIAFTPHDKLGVMPRL